VTAGAVGFGRVGMRVMVTGLALAAVGAGAGQCALDEQVAGGTAHVSAAGTVPPMATTHPDGSDVRAVAYIAVPAWWARVWHADPACPATARSGVVTDDSGDGSLVGLAYRQDHEGRTPCWVCAVPAVLDAVAALAVGPGSRHLACDAVHRPPSRPVRCARCDALVAYAADRPGILVAKTTAGRVALLIPGAPTALSVAFGLLGTMRLVSAGSAGPDTPVMSVASWAAAADMLSSRVATPERERGWHAPTLTQALQAAAALHASPAR